MHPSGHPWNAGACANALLDEAQMTAADRQSIAAGVPGEHLMQNAGQAVVREILRLWTPRPTVVLCGPGNNGGDGFVAARLLEQCGWHVRVALLGERDKLRGDARHHAGLWAGPVEPLRPATVAGAGLVVDAIFGSGLSRPLDEIAAGTLAAAAAAAVPLIAVDVPSGVRGDTGDSWGAVPAACTVTFVRKKPGHLLLPGRSLCGELIVADIGTPRPVLDAIAVDTLENDPATWLGQLPRPGSCANKYARGHALLIGGYPMTGAARMSGRAAARAGAGLTTIAVPEMALPIYAASLTSIMVRPISAPADFDEVLMDKRFSAFLIGPGAGVGAETRRRALGMLATARPVVLDADAISVFAPDPESLDSAVKGPCVITPHDGEFARLFDTAGDKLSRVRRAARRCGAVVVLKGADTVIAAPDGRAIVNANAPATLATAGSGDVLSGIILGLLAQGMDAFLASAAAVWLHGAAAADFGPGLLAEDLPDLLPAVFRRLGF
jgi:NAD(P)H-hydrate epimerase